MSTKIFRFKGYITTEGDATAQDAYRFIELALRTAGEVPWPRLDPPGPMSGSRTVRLIACTELLEIKGPPLFAASPRKPAKKDSPDDPPF